VEITPPTDGTTFSSGIIITFSASSSDIEDGDLSGAISWSSDIDNVIGTGASISVVLSDGTHIITASVTDINGKTGSDSITITVGSPPVNNDSVTADSILYSTEGGRLGTTHLRVFVKLIDNNGNPVANASVKIDLMLNDDLYMSLTGSSASDGIVSFKVNNAPSGTYYTVIKEVTASGLLWDGITPDNTFTKK
jgi:hypothetical protein